MAKLWKCPVNIAKSEIVARKRLEPLNGSQDVNMEIVSRSYHTFYDSRVPVEISLDRLGVNCVDKQVKEFLVKECSENLATRSSSFSAWLCFRAESLTKTRNNHKIKLVASPIISDATKKPINPYHCHASLVTTFEGEERLLTNLPKNFNTLDEEQKKQYRKLERSNLHLIACHLQSIYVESGFPEVVVKSENKETLINKFINIFQRFIKRNV